MRKLLTSLQYFQLSLAHGVSVLQIGECSSNDVLLWLHIDTPVPLICRIVQQVGTAMCYISCRSYIDKFTYGYMTKDNINRINKTLAKAKRYGFCSKLYTFNELLEHYDDRLFSRMAFYNHCLHHLLEPDSSTSQMTLRTRGHSFNLPRFHFDLIKKSFIF